MIISGVKGISIKKKPVNSPQIGKELGVMGIYKQALHGKIFGVLKGGDKFTKIRVIRMIEMLMVRTVSTLKPS